MVTVWFRAIIELNTDILNRQFRYLLKLRLKTLTTRTSDTEPRKSSDGSPWSLIPVFISVFITTLMFVSWQCHCDPSLKALKRVKRANKIVIKPIASSQLFSSQLKEIRISIERRWRNSAQLTPHFNGKRLEIANLSFKLAIRFCGWRPENRTSWPLSISTLTLSVQRRRVLLPKSKFIKRVMFIC